LRPISHRAVKDIFANSPFFEKGNIEMGGEAVFDIALIEPGNKGIMFIRAFIPVNIYGLTQNDVDSSPIGHPSWTGCFAAEKLIGVSDPSVMFLPKLVLGGTWGWVSLLPESVDENLPFFVCFKLEKDILLPRLDDIDDFFFQPLSIFFREILGFLFRGRSLERDRKEERQKDQEEANFLHRHLLIIGVSQGYIKETQSRFGRLKSDLSVQRIKDWD